MTDHHTDLHITILGIGNTLLTDEGIGIHILNYLQHHFPNLPNTQYIDGGTLSFTLLPLIETATHLIVVDAAEINQPAGCFHCWLDEQMDEFLQRPKRSVHEVSLIDLLGMLRLTERLPLKRALIGIQVETTGWGDNPSPQVAAAIPRVVEEIFALLKTWDCVKGP